MKVKRQRLENMAKTLREEADKTAKLAEEQQNFSLLSKSNALREKAKVHDEEIVLLNKQLTE